MTEGRGRKPLWTAKQAERVLELAAEGVSQRAIAQEVFGSTRLHGRVERILGSRARSASVPNGEPIDLQALLPESVEAPELRNMLRFYDRIRERTGAEPSLADIERILRIYARLHVIAQVEQANAIFRESVERSQERFDAIAKE